MHENWEKVRYHFERLCNLPRDEQIVALANLNESAEISLQVGKLLASDSAAYMDDLVAEVEQLQQSIPNQNLIGLELGAYRITSPLGEGGMSEVYLAERADGLFDAKVAIKFLSSANPRNQKLFDRERRILSHLNHPSIARLIDAGDHPKYGAYLLIEYVDGIALDEYCRQHNLNVLSILKWFCLVVETMSAAHQNLVLHCDLKPAHLIITQEQQLKILDFGIATFLERDSEQSKHTESKSYTPRFAAPEQILGQPKSTRTDVYALGLILFELLSAGQSPFGEVPEQFLENKLAGLTTALKLSDNAGAAKTATLQSDLNLIIGKAIARLPEQRYANTAEFAADLTAIIEQRPISVRKESWAESASRWIRQHKLASVSLLTALLALIGGTLVSTGFAIRASADRDLAIMEATKSKQVATFLESIFQSASPGVRQGPDLSAKTLLDSGRDRMAKELVDQPEIATHLQAIIARSYLNLGLYEDALLLVTPLSKEGVVNIEHAIIAMRLHSISGEFQRTVDLANQLDVINQEANQQAQVLIEKSTALVNLGELEQAREVALKAIKLTDSTHAGQEKKLVAQGLLAAIAYNQIDYPSAQNAYQEILEIQLQHFSSDKDDISMTHNNLGTLAYVTGDLESAQKHYLQAIEMMRAFFGVDNRSVAQALRSYGLTLRKLGKVDAAEQSLRESIKAYADWHDKKNNAYRDAALQLIELYLLTSRDIEAIALLNDLPAIDPPESSAAQQVECRLLRIKQVLQNISAVAANCTNTLTLNAANQTFELYLQARALNIKQPLAAKAAADSARELLRTVVPADPILLKALEQY